MIDNAQPFAPLLLLLPQLLQINGVVLLLLLNIMACACRGPGGAATIVPYDLCIAADASGGGHLVTSALQELQDRQAAHKHPSSPAHHSSIGSSAAGGVSELEYRAWQDMPPDAALAAMLGQPVGASTASR